MAQTAFARRAARAVERFSALAADRGWFLATYNPALFRYYHRVAKQNAPGVIGAIEETFPEALSYLDVGAGSGAFAAEARRRGKYVTACEHSPFGRAIARAQQVDVRDFDLEQSPPVSVGPADLAFSLEVGEHLPPELGHGLVAFLVEHAPNIVFSAAPPGQGGTGHINEQPQEYWIDEFRSVGGEYDAEASDRLRDALDRHPTTRPWYRQNAMAFRGRPHEVG
jgi:SAM-dependent methyltransferase